MVENPKVTYKKNHKLYININDKEEYFLIHFANDKHKFNIPFKYDMTSTKTSVTYTIIDENLIEEVIEKETEKKESLNFHKDEETKKQLSFLEKYTLKIKEYLVQIEKTNSTIALILLLIASFVYGIIHALGPGHGKALAFSYFTAQKSSFLQAFTISMATAFIHIVGAFILVVVPVFILQSVLNSFIEDSISYLTSLCAVLIMILSIYILYRKLKHKSCACSSCCSLEPKMSFTQNGKFNSLKNTNNKPIIQKENRKKQDLFFVLTAGLIPCPGTVLLFVYAFILETYFSVILASIAISLGMGIVIFASSFLGLSVNKISNKSHKLTNALEIIAPIFMFGLGVLLLVGANI